MNKKTVFLDIDGTLVDKLETIHPSTIEAVRKARENGHRLFISSGRYRGIMPRCLAPLGFKDGVFAAGANVICDGKVIYNRTFSPDVCDRIIAALIKHKALTVVETQRSDDILGATYREEFALMRKWLTDLGGRVLEQTPVGASDVGKFVFKSSDCTNEQLQQELGDCCRIVTMSYPDDSSGGEIMLPDVNKSVGIRRVLEYYGTDIADTVAVGDGGNDIEMLDLCAVSVAMGNAPDAVKKHADIITDRIENDGLYKAFETLGLI